MSSIYDLPVTSISGEPATLAEHAGKVLLIVNVASKCGLTPQYSALESVYQSRSEQGFAVLGFPANNFGAQEPGTDPEIVDFCSATYGVQFPMYSKISVVGDDQHPLYAALTAAVPSAEGDVEAMREKFVGYGMTPNQDPDILWNFEKFLIARSGQIVRRFAPSMTPDDSILLAAIDEELSKTD
jgi:glutathione peroxidase